MTRDDYVDSLHEHWDRQQPGLPKAEYAFAVRLIRGGRQLEDALSRPAQTRGLAGRGDYEVLAAIHRAAPEAVRPADLARIAMVTTGGMTARLDRLERKGLVTRSHDTTDRRAVNVTITAAGSRLTNEILGASIQATRELFKDLPAGAIDQASASLRATLEGLTEANPTPLAQI